ncbi:MAG: hypothetical protein GY943_30365 [Chloroflexi bacterium]|nr:hypothetical protein [Chloroflexota bacterium]
MNKSVTIHDQNYFEQTMKFIEEGLAEDDHNSGTGKTGAPENQATGEQVRVSGRHADSAK